MIHLQSAVKLPISLEDIHDIKKEAKKVGLSINEKSGKYEVIHNSKVVGYFSPDGTIGDDKTGIVYDLLSSVVNSK